MITPRGDDADAEKSNQLHTASVSVNWRGRSPAWLGSFSLTVQPLYDPAVVLFSVYPTKAKTYVP